MKHLSRIFLFIINGALITSALQATPTLIPVVNGQFAFGQWYFDGSPSSLGGNAGLAYTPALRFSNRFSLIPTLSSNYQGTLSAQEFAGGSNLFQDQWENGVNVKAVHGLTKNWSLKERAGVRNKWLRETKGETWGHGLYDYRIFSVGTEIERKWGKKAAVSLGYDYSFLRFPNYVSLESTQSDDLSREYAGDSVLDTHIHLVTLNGNAPLMWGIGLQTQLFSSPRTYTDQTIVKLDGTLSSEKRKDTSSGLALTFDRGFNLSKRASLIPVLNYGYSILNSNQNHYDARVTTFINNFYDYTQHSAAAKMTLAIKHPEAPILFDLGGSYSRRAYSDRITQSATGTYLSEKLTVTEESLSFGIRFPLSKNLYLKASSAFGKSRSNNNYEEVYRYNYSNSDYQFGFTYDY